MTRCSWDHASGGHHLRTGMKADLVCEDSGKGDWSKSDRELSARDSDSFTECRHRSRDGRNRILWLELKMGRHPHSNGAEKCLATGLHADDR